MIIAITGKSGSGKSYLSEIIAKEIGASHLDIDKISHDVLTLSESKAFLKHEFGNEIFDNEILNRKKLGKIVFNDKSKLEKLNNFCQSKIEDTLDKIIKTETRDIILDYALLFLLKQFDACDIKILLKADTSIRLKRVCERENISEEYFLSRDKSISDINENGYDFIFENINDTETKKLIEFIKHKKEQKWLEKP